MSTAQGVVPNFTPLVVSTSRLDVLDQYGVPYAVREQWPNQQLGELRGATGTARLLWPEVHDGCGPVASVSGIRLLAPVVTDDLAQGLLAGLDLGWKPWSDVLGPSGVPIGTIQRAQDGSIFIPFDPNLAERLLRTEAYVSALSGPGHEQLRRVARATYYRIRPMLPRSAQMAMRRRFAGLQDRAEFPRWPAETALHDLHEWLLGLVQMVAGRTLPQISWWPDEHEWAVILTHDVERAAGYARVRELAEIERAHGVRSAWYFVPERDYEVEAQLVETLWHDGFEVGVHGLRHDGRDMTPAGLASRIDRMRQYADRWGAVGFRAPASQRGWSQVERLGFDYDSSYMDVARYEPQSGGSCSWLPFFVGNVVELPMTLPMDHTIFDVLGHSDAAVWHEKTDLLRSRGGMAMLLTHPDYLDEGRRRKAYVEYLKEIATDATAWRALPRDASAWWRARSASRIERVDTGWTVTGPAAGRARVQIHDRERMFRAPSSLVSLLGSLVLTAAPISHDVLSAALAPIS